LANTLEHLDPDGLALQPREEAADGVWRPASDLGDLSDRGALGSPQQGKHLRILSVRPRLPGSAGRARALSAGQGSAQGCQRLRDALLGIPGGQQRLSRRTQRWTANWSLECG
jgi:hypothetical protein